MIRHSFTPHRRKLSFVSVLMCLSIGCSTQTQHLAEPDSILSDHVKSGHTAFNEGLLESALKEYKLAVVRAWAIDDPFESGNAAYNMAGCLFSQGYCDQANMWLIDSRVDLARAKVSAGNNWLLTANVATAQGCFDEALSAVNHAKRSGSTCGSYEQYQLQGPAAKFIDDNCDPPRGSRLPWLGKKILDKKATEDCQTEHCANIHLTLARLAVAQQDASAARTHLKRATNCADCVCSLGLQAARHDVAADIYDLELNHLQAGAHRDREAELLRAIGEYREIPKVLRGAADSYCIAGRCDLSVDRLIRCARIYLARQDVENAWANLKLAGDLITIGVCDANEVRFRITGQLLQEMITQKGEPDGLANSPTSPSKTEQNDVVDGVLSDKDGVLPKMVQP